MESHGLSTIDIIIAVSYVTSIISIGIYLFKKQKSTKDFFLGGRSMGWLPIGLSLMATLTSAVGYMAFPAGAIKYGIIMLWMAMAIPISFPVVVYVFMPFYHKLKVYTAYEYLERRFSVYVRALASAIFILWRITWMAAVIYVPSMILNVVTNGKIPLIPSVIVLGLIATTNSSLGGIRATMWGDVVHSFVMFTSMIVAFVIIILAVPGGLPQIWHTLAAAGKTAMTAHIPGFSSANIFGKMKFYLFTDITVVSLIITYSIQKMGNYCVDQAMVQRYLTAKSLKVSRQGFITNAFAYLFYIFIVTFIGVGLFAVASHHAFPASLKADRIFPYFIANFMPVGIGGLMIAAIYGASMSSLDSGINSSITAILNDFYSRFKLKKYNLEDEESSAKEKAQRVRIARWGTLTLGITITFFACFVGKMGDIFTYSQKLINMFTGPLFGVFTLGMFTKRVTAPAVLIAGFIGFVLGTLTAFSKFLDVSWFKVGVLWPATIAFVTTIVLGYILSFFVGQKNPEASRWTWRGVMKG
ncbi:MAG: sodium/solute symporter [Calditrichaeota bacterium]|nr:sodium/solute symporter [Calditrichota bacterium]